MCAQCMAGAAAVATGAAGTRAFLGGWIRARFGPRALSRLTAVLLGGALVASAFFISG